MDLILALGSNIGDRSDYILRAIAILSHSFEFISQSSFYETQPLTVENSVAGGMYINACVHFVSDKHQMEVFNIIKSIEESLGRISRPKWSEREIDIDIISYGNIIFLNNSISIPHAELQNRAFVLQPMFEIVPDFIHPVLHKRVGDMLREII